VEPPPCLLAEFLLLVVECDNSDAAQDRLPQPLEPEDEQQAADDQSQSVNRQRRQPWTHDRGHSRQHRQRHGRSAERGAPAASGAHGEDDRQGFNGLYRAG
jgi:hypothetical protein